MRPAGPPTRRSPTAGPATFAALLLALGAAACAPTCDQMCSKLDRCAFNPRVSQADCREQCSLQIEVLGDKDTDDGDPEANEEARDAFRAHRVCIGNHSCDELAEGACYDPAVFPF